MNYDDAAYPATYAGEDASAIGLDNSGRQRDFVRPNGRALHSEKPLYDSLTQDQLKDQRYNQKKTPRANLRKFRGMINRIQEIREQHLPDGSDEQKAQLRQYYENDQTFILFWTFISGMSVLAQYSAAEFMIRLKDQMPQLFDGHALFDNRDIIGPLDFNDLKTVVLQICKRYVLADPVLRDMLQPADRSPNHQE